MSLPSRYRLESARLPSGWSSSVVVAVDAVGDIIGVSPDDTTTTAQFVRGAVLPGMPNAHSHAFQRAIAGLTERPGSSADTFWSWRDSMYHLAERLTPEAMNAIAAHTYVEMLKAGYTAVCEFHYVHHRADGRAYEDPLAMCQAISDAATSAGIGLTLLPTLYQYADFGALPPLPAQRRFTLDVQHYLDLVERAHALTQRTAQIEVGLAFHSLRAVTLDSIRTVLDAHPQAPIIHLHIAEQQREVERCVEVLGARPIEWLDAQVGIDSKWCLVHATHAAPREIELLARSGAVVALCPTTEANLGDGLFHIQPYCAQRGTFAIGSDSQIALSPAEELRWLEYQARLEHRARNVLAAGERSTGATLWHRASEGGARACARRIGAIALGHRADWIVLDLDQPALYSRAGDALLDTFIFVDPPGAVRDVMVGGRWLVQDRHHFAEAAIHASYRRAIERLR